jgi:exodeoxyribonuclease VII small subunit
MSAKTNKLPSLEASLAEIAQLVDKMEHGELTLEQSLANFERGITLVKHCQKVLSEAEQKVQLLVQQNGQETLSTYRTDSEGSGDDTSDN